MEQKKKARIAPRKFLHPGESLLSGVDTLILAVDLRWRGDKFFQHLDELQQRARALKRPVPAQLQTSDHAHALMYEVLEHGSDGYRWNLASTEWSILLSSALQPASRPNALIRLSPEGLWLHGVAESIDRVFALLQSVEGFVIKPRISLVDICSDILIPEKMWHRDLIDFKVGHIKKNSIHQGFDKLEGFRLGKGKFLARICDKPLPNAGLLQSGRVVQAGRNVCLE